MQIRLPSGWAPDSPNAGSLSGMPASWASTSSESIPAQSVGISTSTSGRGGGRGRAARRRPSRRASATRSARAIRSRSPPPSVAQAVAVDQHDGEAREGEQEAGGASSSPRRGGCRSWAHSTGGGCRHPADPLRHAARRGDTRGTPRRHTAARRGDTQRHASAGGAAARGTLAGRGRPPREECAPMSDPQASKPEAPIGEPVAEPTPTDDVVDRANGSLAEAEAARDGVPADASRDDSVTAVPAEPADAPGPTRRTAADAARPRRDAAAAPPTPRRPSCRPPRPPDSTPAMPSRRRRRGTTGRSTCSPPARRRRYPDSHVAGAAAVPPRRSTSASPIRRARLRLAGPAADLRAGARGPAARGATAARPAPSACSPRCPSPCCCCSRGSASA